MMRAVGLLMILLGGLGVGVSLVDWKTIDVFLAGGDTKENSDELAKNDGAERKAEDGPSAEGVTNAALGRGPSPKQEGARTPKENGIVAERDPANVRVFEPDEQPSEGQEPLWADISANEDVVTEDSGHARFLLTLSEPAERSVVIIFSTVDLSARDPEDYRSQRGTVTFEPGVVSAEILTPLVDDDVKEEDEQFAIVLNGAPGIVNFRSRRITTTIKDDD